MVTPLYSWNSPQKNLKLASNEIHVWRVFLQETASCLQSLQQNLSADELNRLERYYFQKDREQFIVSRGALRAILSRYLDINPRTLNFAYNLYGKPFLDCPLAKNTLCFNLSHSHGVALIAITENRDIGIDIECIRKNLPYQEIAERFFSPLEKTVLRSLPEHLQHQAFFTCWTRKEAYIKAVGKGLSIPLDRFDVTLAPGEPAALLNFQDDPQEIFKWNLIELIPASDMVAALAVEGYCSQLQCFQY
jgi:4'-phosphopantetheinyl transferase